jgi:hypothetical protein
VKDVAETAGEAAAGVVLKKIGQKAANQEQKPEPPPPPVDEHLRGG